MRLLLKVATKISEEKLMATFIGRTTSLQCTKGGVEQHQLRTNLHGDSSPLARSCFRPRPMVTQANRPSPT